MVRMPKLFRQTSVAYVFLLASVFVAPALAALPAPSNLTATSISSAQINLSWADNSTGEINFTLMYATNNAFTGPTQRVIAANATSFPHMLLSPATTYWYRIKANGSGGSPWSAPAFATTTPSSLSAAAASSSAVDLSWTGNASNSNITGYTVQYATDPAFSGAQDSYAGASAATTYRLSGLAAGQLYYFKIKAEGSNDSFDSAFSPAANAATPPQASTGPAISPLFFGINAWLPKTIAGVDKGGKLETKLCGVQYTPGALCVPAEIAASGVQIMRYGGKTLDKSYVSDNDLSPNEYLVLVKNMRENDIKPILQVPYHLGDYTATQAANLVSFINMTMDSRVKYWSIANEPNRGDYVDPVDPTIYWTASQIAPYFRSFAQAMKEVDPTIKITGPDLAFYDAVIMNDLTDCPDGPYDITGSFIGTDNLKHYYVDVLNFHTYPFNGYDATPTRQAVIDQPSGGFQDNLNALKKRVNRCNNRHGRTGTSALKMAVTEMNVDYQNPVGLDATQILEGVGAQSFLAGQYWADAMNVGMKNGLAFMTFWSVIEGDGDDGRYDLGYIASNGTRRSTYFHFQMLARNFRGNYVPGTTTNPNVKAFGAKDSDQIAVMILNQTYTELTYTVRLNTALVTVGNALQIKIDAGVAREYNSPTNEPIAGQSTVLLVFDAGGTLLERHQYSINDAINDLEPSVLLY